MDKYTCPSCGAPFNGKKCKNCAYESFSEEIAHNLHVHKGEPLVIHDTARKPVPYKDPFDCPKPPKQKTVKKGKLLTILMIVFLVLFLIGPIGMLIENIHVLSPTPTRTEPVTLPLDAKTLLDDDRFTIAAKWDYGPNNPSYSYDYPCISLYIVNHTDKTFNFTDRNLTVNGFCLEEFSSFYAQAEPGSTVEANLYLGEQGLQIANISQIQQIEFSLEATTYSKKGDDVERYHAGPFTLRGNASTDYVQPDLTNSQMVYADENLVLSYVCLWANDFDETLEDMELIFCAENISDQELSLYDEQILVNGDSSDVSLWARIPANSKTLFKVYLYGIDLPTPEDVQSFVMDLHIMNEGGEDTLAEDIQVPIQQ